jgi:hypothetical protein
MEESGYVNQGKGEFQVGAMGGRSDQQWSKARGQGDWLKVWNKIGIGLEGLNRNSGFTRISKVGLELLVGELELYFYNVQ